jgi:hypothetical protein
LAAGVYGGGEGMGGALGDTIATADAFLLVNLGKPVGIVHVGSLLVCWFVGLFVGIRLGQVGGIGFKLA